MRNGPLVLFILAALTALAANSVLARLALGDNAIDAGSFTLIRLFSGALFLSLIFLPKLLNQTASTVISRNHYRQAWWLFLYAVLFSYAYIELNTGLGALLLFAAVQLGMMFISFFQGQRYRLHEWLGIGLAFAGLLYMLMPQIQAPESLIAALLMLAAGVSWAFYTLAGRSSKDPYLDTTINFILTLPWCIGLLAVIFVTPYSFHITSTGAVLAAISGAITSGLGYVVWYSVVSKIKVTTAAVGQLSVPLLAALGGILFADELISLRFLTAALLILGGILIVVWPKRAA